MDEQSIEKRERWLKRIQNERRNYSYQKWIDKPDDKNVLITELLKWILDDITFLIKWNINLLLQLRAYGSVVKKYSGLSFVDQWKRMGYLVFVIRTDSSNFRYNHLFENERWEKVDLFSYSRHNLIEMRTDGFSPKEDVNLINNKNSFYRCCERYGWHTPKIYAIYDQGILTYSDEDKIRLPKKDLFIKNVGGGQGRCAQYLTYENDTYRDLDKNEFDTESLLDYLQIKSKERESLLIQDAKKNHAEWKKFSNGSLATCRIVSGRSLKKKNEIEIFFASLRMPIGKMVADNYSLGGIASAIDIETGVLGRAVSSKPYKGSFSWDFHPDSGEKIEGSQLFKWDEILELTREIHSKFKTFSVGWDLTLTEEGPCVIEGNPFWGSEVLESPANKPLYLTSYPLWVEEYIEILSNKNSARTDENEKKL